MKSMRELQDYIDKTEDNSLAMIVDVVKEFGNELPSLINELKTHHTASKKDADMIFSTVHRCKGMEYDSVTLLNDFITEDKLKRYLADNDGKKINDADKNRLAEEINILYVACTRARNKLIIPPGINPLRSIELGQTEPPVSPHAIKPNYRNLYRNHWDTSSNLSLDSPRCYTNDRRQPGNHGSRWTKEEEAQLVDLFGERVALKDIARRLSRGENSIRKKLVKLGLMETDDFF